jgi:hypothetical protein
MAWSSSQLVSPEESRLQQIATYQMHLARQPASAPAGASGIGNAALSIPEPLPTASVTNSWLLYDDPLSRFHLLHPQELEPSPEMVDPNTLELVNQNHGTGRDVFILTLSPGAEDPPTFRRFRDLDQFQRGIDADWKNRKLDLIHGPAGWLPDADWAPWRVFRKELGVKAAGATEKGKAVERIYVDHYLVLSKRNECFHVQSMTVRDDHVAFRAEAEGVIKSFGFGAWKAPARTPSAPAEPPLTPPR